MHHLIVCEKPSAARKVAFALGGGKAGRVKQGLPFYRFSRAGDTITVVSALGHLYAPVQQGSGWSFPVFNLVWKPVKNRRARAFIQEISSLAKEADSFISACDYDTEGSLIAFMVLRYACHGSDRAAKRMKFSSLTKSELISAYENASKLDVPVIMAGMTRHEVDWIFGVNISRAIMDAYSCNSGGFEVLSAGRVQGPTLSALWRRERTINLHVPDPFWTIEADLEFEPNGEVARASFCENPVLSKRRAEEIVKRCAGIRGTVSRLKEKEIAIPPPCPFNLGDLQAEAFRVFRFPPLKTQKEAERLYLEGLISYPRTVSQQLPPSIGYRRILEDLGENREYAKEVEDILRMAEAKGGLRPRQGKNTDPAHPAIYPTGISPGKLVQNARKVYDLIVRRFLSVFGPAARKTLVNIEVRAGDECFKIDGELLMDPGWMKYYKPYARAGERAVPEVKEGDGATVLRVWKNDRFTQPPPRFNQSSLLRYMERNSLGTKGTRAEIVSTLYKRGYITGSNISVTELGRGVLMVLSRHFPELTTVRMSRELEKRMEAIEEGTEDYAEVLLNAAEKAKEVFEGMVYGFEEVGAELNTVVQRLRKQKSTIGSCPHCRTGVLEVLRSRKTGKRFLGCSNYGAGCSFSAPLPQRGTIRTSGKVCSSCGFPIIAVTGGYSKTWTICINPECPSKMRA
ncbi:MAG: DNA topoisomerase I [Candidatus Verstraetearchaeota archaeon]|nr:DNA topoisomerase I [Candidatus Verstraetearchaeota archaeon]